MRSDVLHRWGPVWPPGITPAKVRWQTNATLVLVSYKASLAYLRTLPGGLMDLVVYHKPDFGAVNLTYAPMTANYVLGQLREQELCGAWTSEPAHSSNDSAAEPPFSASSASSITGGSTGGSTGTTLARYGYPINIFPPSSHVGERLHHPSRSTTCPRGCRCGRRTLADRPRLQYFALLPNYGKAYTAPRGGSREPYGYLQFIRDFWDNLPPVVIFSQDDCLTRGCMWGNQLPGLGKRLQLWEQEWGPGKPISQRNCLCKYVRENKFIPKGYFWYKWMAFAQEHMLNTSLADRSITVTWPQDATFAVSSTLIRAQPLWMYESLARLTTVESACIGAGTIMWAHTLERLWFELLDPGVPKELKAIIDRDIRGACFLGARRRRN